MIRLKPSPLRRLPVLAQAAVIFVPLALMAGVVMYVLFHVQLSARLSVLRANEEKIVGIGQQGMTLDLQSIVSDLRYLAHQPALQDWLASEAASQRRDLAETYRVYASEKVVYDQIRLLDIEGREVVRVNRGPAGVAVVPDDRLQAKGDRYYVRETIKLAPGQIYVSPFDLNVENGVVEEPIKPMIRFGTPIVDTGGRTRGMIILNYLGQLLLDRLEALSASTQGEIWLLNGDGYWLHGPSPADEWAFMYADRQDRSFARAYPEAWARIRDGGARGQISAGEDFMTYTRIALDTAVGAGDAAVAKASSEAPANFWILVAHVPTALLTRLRNDLARVLLLPSVSLACLLAAIALVIARHRVRRAHDEDLIRYSEARFRALLESAPDGIIISDSQGRIVLVNAQTERLVGYSRDRLVGEAVETLVPERFRQGHAGHRADYVANASVRPMGLGQDLYGLRADGTEFPVSIGLSTVETEDGVLVISEIRDVTAWRDTEMRVQELNERLTRDNAELAALNQELEAFSYSVSHDLRTPLRAIDGFSQALAEDCGESLNTEGRDYLARIRAAAQHMGRLIDDMLKLSRVTRADMHVAEVDMGALARDIMATVTQSEPMRSAEIRIADNLQVQGDQSLLQIALENLLGNAWKFTARSAPAQIEMGRCRHNGEAAYFVKDNGVGFDMEHAAKLFGAFQRLHNDKEFPGTGIGLATVQRVINKHGGLSISQSIIQVHGGRIWAQSEIGKGATFYFTL